MFSTSGNQTGVGHFRQLNSTHLGDSPWVSPTLGASCLKPSADFLLPYRSKSGGTPARPWVILNSTHFCPAKSSTLYEPRPKPHCLCKALLLPGS